MTKGDRARELEKHDGGSISMLISLLRTYYWLDEAVRNYVISRGAPTFTRSQGMVMANIILGVHQPSEIARQLDVSRQAIHTTLRQMQRKGIVKLSKDPNNSRITLAHLTDFGIKMRNDGRDAMRVIVEEIGGRIGKSKMKQLVSILDSDWGPALKFSPELDYMQGYRSPRPKAKTSSKPPSKKK